MGDAEVEGTRRWRRAARLGARQRTSSEGAGKGGEGRRGRGAGASNRGRSLDRPGERVEFRFSGFRAVQVPVVSDRLLIAIISVDNGKTIAKSSKAAARNGICQWPDSILEPIWFSQDEVSKEFQECHYKIVVSMGSTKTAVLGEVILNLANYLSSSDSTDISLPLKRCNSGTVLQLKIQCLGVKYKSSGKSWNELSPRLDDSSPTNVDMDRKSDGSDSILNKDDRLGGAYQDEAGNTDASFSVPESHRSSNSGDSATGRKNLSPRDKLNEGLYTGRQDSGSSYASHDSAGRGDDSSKGLHDTAKETIEELRDAAKMWERHSRKLKIELERLKNDCADKSKQQAELARELSASCSERDSLRQEIEELKSSLEEVTAHQTIVGTPKSGDVIDLPKEIKDDVQFLIESNASLTAQLNKAQEANIELVSILQELEETIELQRVEVSNLSHASDVVDQDVSKNESTVQEEAEWARTLSLKEDEIAMLREKLDRILSIENADGAGPDAIYLELEKENDFLKVKIQELENDCSELTEENLELIYNLKEVSGVEKGEDPCISNSEEMPNVGRSTSKVKYLEKKCADLELNLLNFRSEFSELEEKFQKSQDELKERTLELSELREKLFHATELEGTETGSARRYQLRSGEPDDTEDDLDVLKRTVLLKGQEIDGLQHSTNEMENIISDIQEKNQLEERLAAALQESSMASKCLDEVREDLLVLTSSVDSHVSANKVLQTKISELESCKVNLESHVSKLEHENIELSEFISELEAQLTSLTSEMESTQLQIDDSVSLITILKDKIEQQQAEMEAQNLEANKVLETKISELESCKVELESHISKLEHENIELSEFISELEAQLTSVTSENESTKVQMDDFGSLITNLKDKVEQQQAEMEAQKLEASANKVLETKISELESCKVELESHISMVEHENIELSESISELEAQLTSVTSEKESTKLQIDDFTSLITNLKDKVEQQQAEMEAQKLELEQKHLESQRRLSEVQEDSEALRRSNAKLQATIDSVVEESNSLQTLIADLKKQKLELHDRSTQLEQELEESKRKTMDFCEMVEFLEARLSSLQKDITSKEQSLLSELENIFQEHKEHEERINRAHFLLNKIENEKIVEVKNLEREVIILTAQVSSTHGDQESAALDSIREVSILRADKAKLEANLEDINAQMRHYESQLEDLRKESQSKIKGLVDSLNASKQNEETLTTDVEHMRRLMEAAKSNEENLRKASGELELKYKSSDYEKQLIMDEISGLKIQVNKMASLQDEVFKLQSSLDEAKFEKGKLEGLLQSLSEECEELKVQKAMLTDKVSCMQGTLHDAEEENRSKSMQVKLEIKQGNDDVTNDNGGSPVNENPDTQSKIQLLESRLAEALEENKLYRAKLQSPTGEGQSDSREGKENTDDKKIAQLESELKDMQDRFLNMSLQYAEVEAQREQLVMELKSATAKKGRWF